MSVPRGGEARFPPHPAGHLPAPQTLFVEAQPRRAWLQLSLPRHPLLQRVGAASPQSLCGIFGWVGGAVLLSPLSPWLFHRIMERFGWEGTLRTI